MRRTDSLNDRQLEVLRSIARGDAEDPGPGLKQTARALQDRGLVIVRRLNGRWQALVTDAGRYYLEHGAHPDALTTLPPNEAAGTSLRRRPRSPAKVSSANKTSVPSPDPAEATPSVARQGARRSPTEELVAAVVDAGGELDSGQLPKALRHRVHDLVRMVNRYGKAPTGTRLVLRRTPGGDRWSQRDELALEEGPVGTDAALEAVPVPDHVRQLHPALSELRLAGGLSMKPPVRQRALRVLHAVATEAERRGYTADSPRPTRRGHEQPSSSPWHLVIDVGGDRVPLRLLEEVDRTEHEPTARELARARREPWHQPPTHDRTPSGRLHIEVGGDPRSDLKTSWADRTRWRLEDKLPDVLRAVNVRADELRLHREAKAQAEREYRETLEREQARARDRAAEKHRKEQLDEQLGRWRETKELRAYAAELADRLTHSGAAGPDSETPAESRAWLAWVERRADRLDPLSELPTMPVPPDLPDYRLREFMRHVHEPTELHWQPPDV